MYKFPKLTDEELSAFLKKKREFFDFYNLNKTPLYSKIASGLIDLSINKLLGLNGLRKDKISALNHYLKACMFDPKFIFSSHSLRKELGLLVYNKG